MREEWKGLVEAYLEGAPGPDLSVVLIDARHPPTEMDQELVDWLRKAGRRSRIALTKIDKLPRGRRAAAVAAAASALGTPPDALPIPVSAVTGDGIPALWRVVDVACERTRGDSTPPQPLTPPHIPQGERHHRERQRHGA
jgi:GTP-binding protein